MSQDLTFRIDFNAPVTMAGAADAGGRFVRWWLTELISLLPHRWQQSLQATLHTPCLVFGKDEWQIELDGNGDAIICVSALQPAHELREQLEQMAPAALSNSVDVVVPKADVLTRRIGLPAAASKRLKSVVRLQLDRLSPFRGDDVQFDTKICDASEAFPNGNATNDIMVDVAIIPKKALRAIEQTIREVGLVPRLFRVADSTFTFAPAGLPWTKQRQSQAVLVLTGIVFWLAAFWLAPVLQEREITSLSNEIASQEPKVRHAAALREELSRYQLPPQALLSNRAHALDLLLELTQQLPKEARVTNLELIDAQVTLRGTAAQPAEVLQLLKKSKLITQVVTLPNSQNRSQFALRATLRQSP